MSPGYNKIRYWITCSLEEGGINPGIKIAFITRTCEDVPNLAPHLSNASSTSRQKDLHGGLPNLLKITSRKPNWFKIAYGSLGKDVFDNVIASSL